MTSSPGPTPSASSARCKPAVAELTASECRPGSPRKVLKSSSKRLAFGPVVIQPDRSVSMTSAISSSPISGSANGRKGTVVGICHRLPSACLGGIDACKHLGHGNRGADGGHRERNVVAHVVQHPEPVNADSKRLDATRLRIDQDEFTKRRQSAVKREL